MYPKLKKLEAAKDYHRSAAKEVERSLLAGEASTADAIIAVYSEAVKRAAKLAAAEVGDRVKARIRVYGPPVVPVVGGIDGGRHIHAEPGETGVVVHVEEGLWPTVQFDRTGTATMVCPIEAELFLG